MPHIYTLKGTYGNVPFEVSVTGLSMEDAMLRGHEFITRLRTYDVHSIHKVKEDSKDEQGSSTSS